MADHGPAAGHRRGAPRSVGFGLLTVSDTRTPATDLSGARMRALIEAAGHRVVTSSIVPDEPAAVRARVAALAEDPGCEAIVTSGGTGLGPRDRTVEAVETLFEIRLSGFGELFRMLSFGEIGSAAMLSRATAGIVRARPVFLLPGSPAGVDLALTRLVLPEIGHVVAQLSRDGDR
jgi:molybdopterin adenylyltransferase